MKDGQVMRAYKVVDAFSSIPFKGNPVAVVVDGEGLSGAEMQTIAAWTNLSETTFLLPATDLAADYRLRIFTPRSEMPFAGHPTLGSAHAALEAGLVKPNDGVLVQECRQGLVRIAVEGEGEMRRLILDLPTATVSSLAPDDVTELEAILGVAVDHAAPPALVDVGARWIVARIASADALLAIMPDFARSAKLEARLNVTGVSLFGAHHGVEASIEVRSFAPSCGANEDPVCGSGNGSIAVFRHVNGLLAVGGESYVATQGRKVGRDGRIAVGVDAGGKVTIGGSCVTCIDGLLRTAP